MTLFINQEFCEVPRDGSGSLGCRVVETALHSQELVYGTSVHSIDFSFLEHWESYSVSGFRPLKDLIV